MQKMPFRVFVHFVFFFCLVLTYSFSRLFLSLTIHKILLGDNFLVFEIFCRKKNSSFFGYVYSGKGLLRWRLEPRAIISWWRLQPKKSGFLDRVTSGTLEKNLLVFGDVWDQKKLSWGRGIFCCSQSSAGPVYALPVLLPPQPRAN